MGNWLDDYEDEHKYDGAVGRAFKAAVDAVSANLPEDISVEPRIEGGGYVVWYVAHANGGQAGGFTTLAEAIGEAMCATKESLRAAGTTPRVNNAIGDAAEALEGVRQALVGGAT